MTTDGQ